MKPKRHNPLLHIFLCLIFYLSFSINAYPAVSENLIEFSLSTQSHSSNFKFPTTAYEVHSDQLGISWYEPFSHYFQAGLEVGYIEMSQLNNPVSSAQFTSGQYAGLLLRFLPVTTSSLSLILNLDYRYNRTEGVNSGQNSQFAWHETVFSSEIQFHPVELVSFFVAAEYQLVNGEQRDSGDINQIKPFSEAQQEGYRYGLDLTANRTGIIRLEGFSGFKDGVSLYFKRKF